MTIDDNIRFAKKLLVENIYHSINIEGIAMTFPETQTIVDGMSVKGHRIEDINAVNDLKNAWYYILDTIQKDYAEPVTLKHIQKINHVLGRFTVLNAGHIRNMFDEPVGIGGTSWQPSLPPKEAEIEQELARILSNSDIYEAALDLFCYIVRRQLFLDGNKRTATLASNMYLIGHGAGIFSIPAEKKESFYKELIAYYESGDAKNLKEFLYPCITKSYTKTLGQRLQILRQNAGLNREQAAIKLAIPKERLFSLELDEEIPTNEELVRICGYFEMEPEVLTDLS
ncbi:MAG: Fic family protein [Muribaculaceae bacterium]|nr:Fic family protein [Roseburia sp.]MCM1430342.1 Fic family protein [Muribaculaceae bacterium]MCM1492462.1 Fic family protein [Muribaculaceae bacterium]